MKKTLVAAITSAIVIGAASTTFAAANPFSDVPTDHWSFDAVAKLAQEGVIEGYGDGTFRGDSHITRYEMAQMVAKAMAKDLTGSDKATVDKLAAEYANELNNLGVRVANLEKKSDNVVFTGEARFRFDQNELEFKDGVKLKNHKERGLFRLNAKAQVNEEWTANARLEAKIENLGEGGNGSVTVDRIYAQGPLFGATAKLGKIPVYTEQGYILDDPVSGAQFQWKGDKLTTTLIVGRVSEDLMSDGSSVSSNVYLGDGAADYQSLDLKYAVSDNTSIDLAYNHFSSEKAFYENASYYGNLADSNDIWTLGFDTKLGADFGLKGIYAKSGLDVQNDDGYSVELNYKGADPKEANTYGIWVAYRDVPHATAVSNTWNGSQVGAKGYEIGTQYVFANNIMATLAYFDGERVDNSDVDHRFFRGQVEFFF